MHGLAHAYRVRLLQRGVRKNVCLGEVVRDRGVSNRPDELDRSIESVRPRPARQPVSRAEPSTDKAEDSVGAEPPHFAEGPDQAGDILAIVVLSNIEHEAVSLRRAWSEYGQVNRNVRHHFDGPPVGHFPAPAVGKIRGDSGHRPDAQPCPVGENRAGQPVGIALQAQHRQRGIVRRYQNGAALVLAGQGELVRPVRMDDVTRCAGQQIGDRAPFRREEVPGAVPCTLPVRAYPYVQGWSGKVLQFSDLRRQGDEVHGKPALQQGFDEHSDRPCSHAFDGRGALAVCTAQVGGESRR